jgi:hypothetical protein
MPATETVRKAAESDLEKKASVAKPFELESQQEL